ncbi:MBL fold metallo-hydrolase [Roseovarius sp. SYSU LYC5161]|uniref:MBL fold metallo-hydrolase n=1 Tax=Roseovarius halophilus (ex Wu et al. 2025) TaxID=3376060 RepID=UPI00399B8693
MNRATTGIRYPWETPPDHGAAREIADGVLWLRLPLPMALDHVNVYALDDGDGWTVIDTGFDSRKSRAIWETALAGQMAGKPVTRVICTHHHPDHMGLAGWFQEADAELAMPRTGWLMARMLQLDEQPAYPARSITFYQRAGMDAEVLKTRRAERPFNFADCTHPLPLGFTRLQEGQMIRMAGRDWDIRMGNGHAPEQATFWSCDDDLVLAGDQLLPSISPNIGVYPTEPEADPLAEWLDSCARFQPLAEDRHLVLGGHKLPFTGLPLRLTQLIENHHGALQRLMGHLSEPRRAGDCFLPIFKREISGGQYGLALVEALAHLNHLYQTGRATRELREDGAWWFQAR